MQFLSLPTVNVPVDDLSFYIDRYIADNEVPSLTSEDLRELIFQEFEEEDKKRGVPYLTPARSIADNYMSYTEDIELGDNEVPLTGESLEGLFASTPDLPSASGEEEEVGSEEELTPSSILASLGIASAPAVLKESRKRIKEETRPPKKKKKVRMVRRVVVIKPKVQPTAPKKEKDPLLDTVFADIIKEETPKETYHTVRDLVANNSGCTVQLALKHFTPRQVEQAITAGRVYKKANRLYA